MAIISCPECGKQVSDRAISCPECGCPISAAPAVPVQQNSAEELSKLITLARRAREASDSKNAKRYYEQILDKDPGNWEATFYTVYYEAIECKIMYISSAANSVANCIYSTFAAIADLEDKSEQGEALNQVISSSASIAVAFANAATRHYNEFSTTNNALSEYTSRLNGANNIYIEIDKCLKKLFPEEKRHRANFLQIYVEFLKSHSIYLSNAGVSGMQREIAEVYPEYGQQVERENKKSALSGQIAGLNSQINNIVTERKAPLGCLGYFFLIVGGIMLFLGMALASLDGGSWPIFVAIPELIIAALCLKKKPSQEEVDANIQKKNQLIAQRDELQRQLDAMK